MFGYWLPAAAVLLVLYIVGGAVYRLFFHPLAKFPGPRLAAVTVWYEAYYDVVGKGQYIFKLKELHDKYGRATQRLQERVLDAYLTLDTLRVGLPLCVAHKQPASTITFFWT